MASNLSCLGMGVEDAAQLGRLIDRMLPNAQKLGKADGVTVYRWQDPSGARLTLGWRGSELVDLLPSFAGEPGVGLRNCVALNADTISGSVVDAAGEQTTAMAFELEQRRAFRKRGTWSGVAAVAALAGDAEFFASPDLFAASRRSLLDPDADLDAPPPAGYVERGLAWPPRMADSSFISAGVFQPTAEATASARLNGRVLAAGLRQNSLTGDDFLWCRVECLGFELDVLAPAVDDVVPEPGWIVAGTAFLVASIESLVFPRGWRRLVR